jgi:hypothetical protein
MTPLVPAAVFAGNAARFFSADWRLSSGKLHYSIRTKHQPYSKVATQFPTC